MRILTHILSGAAILTLGVSGAIAQPGNAYDEFRGGSADDLYRLSSPAPTRSAASSTPRSATAFLSPRGDSSGRRTTTTTPARVVRRTDAIETRSDRSRVIGRFPADSAVVTSYPAAVEYRYDNGDRAAVSYPVPPAGYVADRQVDQPRYTQRVEPRRHNSTYSDDWYRDDYHNRGYDSGYDNGYGDRYDRRDRSNYEVRGRYDNGRGVSVGVRIGTGDRYREPVYREPVVYQEPVVYRRPVYRAPVVYRQPVCEPDAVLYRRPAYVYEAPVTRPQRYRYYDNHPYVNRDTCNTVGGVYIESRR